MKFKTLILLTIWASYLLAAKSASAVVPGGDGGGSFTIRSVFSPAGIFADFGRLASAIILILTSFTGALSMIFIIISGIKLVTAGGDPKKMADARNTLTYAIIGLIVTALAFIILRVVQFFLGANIPIT